MKHTIEKTSHEFSFDKNATIINNTACIYPYNSNQNFLFFVLSACIAIKREQIIGIYCIKLATPTANLLFAILAAKTTKTRL